MTPPTHQFHDTGALYSEATRMRFFTCVYSNRIGGVMTPPYKQLFRKRLLCN